MKIIFLLLVPLFLKSNRIEFETAMKQQKIACTPHYEGNRFSYDQNQSYNLSMLLVNKTNQPLSIHIPNGIFLDETSNTRQNQVLAEAYDTFIPAGRSLLLLFHSYCAEIHHGAVNKSSVFRVDFTGDTTYRSLCEWAQSNQFYNHALQCAVWCISDHNLIQNIYHPDKKRTMELWQLTARLTNKSVPDEAFYSERYTVLDSIDKTMEFELPEEDDIEAGIYDIRGKLIQTFIKGRMPKGKYKFEYRIAKGMYRQQVLYARLRIQWSNIQNTRFALNNHSW